MTTAIGSLAGRVALVTGAGMGIGRGIGEALAARGASVAFHASHSIDGAREAAAGVGAQGGTAIALQGDLTQIANARRAVDESVAHFGRLDILVNNAGVTRSVPFLETTEETYAEEFDLNIRAMFFAAQQAVPHLERGMGPCILNITSVHGFAGMPSHTAYAATKGAIETSAPSCIAGRKYGVVIKMLLCAEAIRPTRASAAARASPSGASGARMTLAMSPPSSAPTRHGS